MKIQIIGCGGVGGNLAYLLTKETRVDHFVLCDHDVVEHKNLSRQFFFHKQIGMNKAEALKENLLAINPELTVDAFPIKIEEDLDLEFFEKEALTILATDNVTSKQRCGKYFHHFALTNCERGIVEIKTFLDKEERTAWDMGGGYMSTQTFGSNMAAAVNLRELILTDSILGHAFKMTLKYPFYNGDVKYAEDYDKESALNIPTVTTAIPSSGGM